MVAQHTPRRVVRRCQHDDRRDSNRRGAGRRARETDPARLRTGEAAHGAAAHSRSCRRAMVAAARPTLQGGGGILRRHGRCLFVALDGLARTLYLRYAGTAAAELLTKPVRASPGRYAATSRCSLGPISPRLPSMSRAHSPIANGDSPGSAALVPTAPRLAIVAGHGAVVGCEAASLGLDVKEMREETGIAVARATRRRLSRIYWLRT